jgi:hypothetical protein
LVCAKSAGTAAVNNAQHKVREKSFGLRNIVRFLRGY